MALTYIEWQNTSGAYNWLGFTTCKSGLRCPGLEDLKQLPARTGRTGIGGSEGVLLPALPRPRPEQSVTLATFVVEQVRVNRCVERRIVKLEREVVSPLFRALRPGSADLRATDINPVAWSVVIGPVRLGDDANALGLQAQSDDLALEIVPDLLEGTDVSHLISPVVFRARDRRGLDGDPEAEDDRRRTRKRAVAQRRTPLGRLSCPERNGRSPGEESRINGVAAQTIEAKLVFGQIKPSMRPVRSRAEPQSWGKDVAYLGCAHQEVGTVQRRKKSHMRQKVASSPEDRSR